MRKLLVWIAIGAILALAIQMYQMPSTDTSVQDSYTLKQDEIETTLEEDYVQPHELYPLSESYSPYIEELDSPVARASSTPSSSKASRPPFVPHFKRVESSSSTYSSQSSASSSSSQSASENDFCTSDRYLERYKTQAEQEAATRFRSKICR